MRTTQSSAFIMTLNALALFVGFCQPARASISVAAVTVANNDTPFILDRSGTVWGFTDPNDLEGWVQIKGLPPIKQLAPFVALTQDGRVFTWGFTHPLTPSPNSQYVTYTTAKEVLGLNGVVSVYGNDTPVLDTGYLDGEGLHFLAILKDGRVAEFGEKFVGTRLVKVGVGPGAEFVSVVKSQRLADPQLIRSISQAVSATIQGINETILSANGFAYRWGLFLRDRQDPVQFHTLENPIKIFVGDDQEKVYSDYDLASLSRDGTLSYWGVCVSGSPNVLNGIKDNVVNIRKFATSYGGWPDVYLLTNGRVVASYPPGRSLLAEQCISTTGTARQVEPKFIKDLPVKIVDIAYPVSVLSAGNLYWVLMVGVDGSLWKIGITPLADIGFVPMRGYVGPQKLTLPGDER